MDIHLTTHDAYAEIVLNRPAKRNALTVAMWRRIPALAAEALAAPGLRLLVLRGAGGVFSGGADIAEFPQAYASRDTAIENQKIIQAAMTAIETFPLPTLAAIEGACFGGGCGLALACDLRFGAANATFAITPAKLGLVYGVDDTRRLVAAVGASRAKDILFTGRTLQANEALQIGLVNALHAPEDLQAAVERFASALAAASAHSARATKRILAKIASGAVHDDEESRAMFGDAFSSADFQEGFRAFMERRPPKFT
jgi:enoyl-CoA hydratase/carnithine racemase